jgi:hypothetical protein
MRAIAAAASRHNTVSVHAPGPSGQITPDGLFDVVGCHDIRNWKPSAPAPSASGSVVIVDELTQSMDLQLQSDLCSRFCIVDQRKVPDGAWQPLLGASHDPASLSLHPYVPINPLAMRDRHHGFGFTGYELVLGGVSETRDVPPEAVRWLTAANNSTNVILISDGIASAWRGRTLRGRTSVESRMDFWRLIAHANVCIDLNPGPVIARECIESLRFGTPIVVPAGSTAAESHAQAGGLIFSDPWELIAAVDTLRDPTTRSDAAGSGRQYADTRFGDPLSFIGSVDSLLSTT